MQHIWMDDLQLCMLLNSISVLSGIWMGDNESLHLKGFSPQVGIEFGAARSAGLH